MNTTKDLPAIVHKRDRVDVTILHAIEPAHFLVREAPSVSASPEVFQFMKLEKCINDYYSFAETEHIHVPEHDEVVIVLIAFDNSKAKYYRGRVNHILETTKGRMYKVHLLDYGRDFNVQRDKVYKIKDDFLSVPFQAIDFHLLGIKPQTLAPNNELDFGLSFTPSNTWDVSAIEFVNAAKNNWKNAQIQIMAKDEASHFYGVLHVLVGDSDYDCFNNLLLRNNYAYYDIESLCKVTQFDYFKRDSDSDKQRTPGDVDPQSCHEPPVYKSNDEVQKIINFAKGRGVGLSQVRKEEPKKIPPNIEVQSLLYNKLVCSKQSTTRTVLTPHFTPKQLSVKDHESIRNSIYSSVVSSETSPKQASTEISTSPSETAARSNKGTPEKPEKSKSDISGACRQIFPDESQTASVNQSSSFSSETKKDQLVKKATKAYADIYRQAKKKSLPLSSPGSDTSQRSSPNKDSSEVIQPKLVSEDIKLTANESPKVANEPVSGKSSSDTLNNPLEDRSISDAATAKCNSSHIPSQHSILDKPSSTSHPINKAALISNYRKLLQTNKVTTKASGKTTSLNAQSPEKPIESCMSATNALPKASEKQSPQACSSATSVSPAYVRPVGRGGFLYSSAVPKTSNSVLEASPTNRIEKLSQTANSKVNSKAEELSSPEIPTGKQIFKKPKESGGYVAKVKDDTGSSSGHEMTKYFDKLLSEPVKDLSLNVSLGEESTDKSEAENEEVNYLAKLISSKLSKSACDVKGANPLEAVLRSEIGQSSHIEPYFKTNLDFSNRSLFDQQRIPALQIGRVATSAILRTEDAPFVKWLRERLKELRFWGPSCIQSVVWPCVIRGRSFVAVAPPHSGKSVAYLLPVLSSLLHRIESGDVIAGNGPHCMVLCSSWRKVQSLAQQVQLFLGKSGKLRIQTAFSNRLTQDNKAVFMNSRLDMLIATPSCLVELLKSDLTNFNRCCHFILDDGNNIVKFHKDEIVYIMKSLLTCLKSLPEVNPVQLGVCAERWSRRIGAFAKKFMPSHQLFFTSFLEAAIYAKIPLYVQMCTESTKAQALLDLLESSIHSNIVISVVNAAEASDLKEILISSAVYVLVAHEAMLHYDLDAVKAQWNLPHADEDKTILILTDSASLNLNISDADCLIHYDLPEDSRLQFSHRFACLADHVLQASKDCASHVLVTEKCSAQAASLTSILQRLGSDIPCKLEAMADNHQKMNVNLDGPLCHFIKSLGYCNQPGCSKRHVICKELDKPAVVPKAGDIQMFVNHVFDASHYYVQILKYVDPASGATVSRSQEYAKLSISIQDYYMDQNNCLPLQNINVNILCAVKEKNNIFHRAKILEVIEDYETEVLLLFIDEGWVKKARITALFILPDQLKIVAPMAAEVYLFGFKSIDPSHEWTPDSSQLVYNMIQGQEVHGKIILCLGNTLFLDPVVIREQELTYVKEPINLVNVGKLLKDKGFAVDNKQHALLLDQARKEEIDLPKITKQFHFEEEKKKVEPNHAFLELGGVEEVYISYVVSPHQIYLQRNKLMKSFTKMQNEIQQRVQNREFSRCRVLQEGMYCLAPVSDEDEYFRAQVLQLTDQDDDTAARVFFVDFGDTFAVKKYALYKLPDDLMLLPFQAIECELVGVVPPHGGWTDKATDDLSDLTRDENDHPFILEVKALKKVPRYGGGNHYTVELNLRDISLSQHLVKEGLAQPVEMNFTDDYSASTPLPEDVDDAAALFAGQLCVMNTRYAEKEEEEMAAVDINSNKMDSSVLNGVSSNSNILSYNQVGMDNLSLNGKAKLTWWENAEKVTVTLHIPDVVIYEFNATSCGFTFSCEANGEEHSYDEVFYSEIVPEKTETKPLRKSLQFVFVKKCAFKWRRLLAKTEKVPYINYDVSHLEVEPDSEEEAKLLLAKIKKFVAAASDSESFPSTDDEACIPTISQMCDKIDPFQVEP